MRDNYETIVKRTERLQLGDIVRPLYSDEDFSEVVMFMGSLVAQKDQPIGRCSLWEVRVV